MTNEKITGESLNESNILGTPKSWSIALNETKYPVPRGERSPVDVFGLIRRRSSLDNEYFEPEILSPQNNLYLESLMLDEGTPEANWKYGAHYKESFSANSFRHDNFTSDGVEYSGPNKNIIFISFDALDNLKFELKITDKAEISELESIGQNKMAVWRWASNRQLKYAEEGRNSLDDSPDKDLLLQKYNEFLRTHQETIDVYTREKEKQQQLTQQKATAEIERQRAETQQKKLIDHLSKIMPNITCPICGNNNHSGTNEICRKEHYGNPNYDNMSESIGRYGKPIITVHNERDEVIGGIVVYAGGGKVENVPIIGGLYPLKAADDLTVWNYKQPFSQAFIKGMDGQEAEVIDTLPASSIKVGLAEKGYIEFPFIDKNLKFYAVEDPKSKKLILYSIDDKGIASPYLLGGNIITGEDRQTIFQSLIKKAKTLNRARNIRTDS